MRASPVRSSLSVAWRPSSWSRNCFASKDSALGPRGGVIPHAGESSPSVAALLGLLRPLLTPAIRYGTSRCRRSAQTRSQVSQGKLFVLHAGHAGSTCPSVRMSAGVPIHCSVTLSGPASYPVPVRHVRVAVVGFLQTPARAGGPCLRRTLSLITMRRGLSPPTRTTCLAHKQESPAIGRGGAFLFSD